MQFQKPLEGTGRNSELISERAVWPLKLNKRNLFEFRSWKQALDIQVELSRFVIDRTPSSFKPRLLCSLDAAYGGEYGFASAVIWDNEASSVTETAGFERRVRVDYMPGFLGFREGPLLVSAAEKLRDRVDVFLVDGHGRAHPRLFGLACQVGLALKRPTVGVAKSLLYGETVDENIISPDGEVLGKVVRAGRAKAHYVSVGHRVELNDAARLVRACLVNNYPAPLRAAHLESLILRRLGG